MKGVCGGVGDWLTGNDDKREGNEFPFFFVCFQVVLA